MTEHPIHSRTLRTKADGKQLITRLLLGYCTIFDDINDLTFRSFIVISFIYVYSRAAHSHHPLLAPFNPPNKSHCLEKSLVGSRTARLTLYFASAVLSEVYMCLSRSQKRAIRLKTEEVYLKAECGLSWRVSPENSFGFRSEQILIIVRYRTNHWYCSLVLNFTRQQSRSNTYVRSVLNWWSDTN